MSVNDIWKWGYGSGGVPAYYRGRLEDQRPLAPYTRERRGEKLECERGKLECEREEKLECEREEEDRAWTRLLVLTRMKESERDMGKNAKIVQLVTHIINSILSGLAGYFGGQM